MSCRVVELGPLARFRARTRAAYLLGVLTGMLDRGDHAARQRSNWTQVFQVHEARLGTRDVRWPVYRTRLVRAMSLLRLELRRHDHEIDRGIEFTTDQRPDGKVDVRLTLHEWEQW